jgi:general secretion pathway protein D
MSKRLLLALVPLAGCCTKPAVPPQTATAVPATAGLVCVVPLKYAVANELAHTIQPLLLDARRKDVRSRASVVADARTNSLVVHADAAEMDRVGELIARLDVDATKPLESTSGGSVRIVPLRYAVASELAETLNALDAASRKSEPPVVRDARIVADARTNSLVVQADTEHREDVERIVELIARLDVEVK